MDKEVVQARGRSCLHGSWPPGCCHMEDCSLSCMTRSIVALAESKMENFQACGKSVLEVSSCLDWWLVAIWGFSSSTKPNNMVKLHLLFITRGRVVEFLAQTSRVMWLSCMLRCRDVAPGSLGTWLMRTEWRLGTAPFIRPWSCSLPRSYLRSQRKPSKMCTRQPLTRPPPFTGSEHQPPSQEITEVPLIHLVLEISFTVRGS